MAQPVGTSSIQIREGDLTGDCPRLNHRLNLMDEQTDAAAKIAKKVAKATEHITAVGGSYMAVPPEPIFGVDRSPWDSTVAEVSGLTFLNPSTVQGAVTATFVFYYVDESISEPATTAAVTLTDSSIAVGSLGDLNDDTYALIDGEIVLLGAHTSLTFPVTRGLLGSAKATHTNGSTVHNVYARTATATFPEGFFALDDSDGWHLEQALPDMKLVAVGCVASNLGGNSTTHVVCKTGNSDHGLPLPTAATPGSAGVTYQIINDNSTPSLSGNGTTGTPFLLLAQAQTLYVTATTQAVFLKLPVEAAMDGVDVTAKLADGSTYSMWLRPNAGDTIDGSGADYEVTLPGSVTLTGLTGGKWIITSQAGSVTPTPAPDAPNILNTTAHPTTVTIDYDTPFNESAFRFICLISLDLTNPNIGHLKELHIMDSDSGLEVKGSPLMQPAGGWFTTPISFVSYDYSQDVAARSGTLTFQARNDDGNIAAGAVSIAYSVRAAVVTGYTSEGEVGTRTANDDRLVYMTLGFVPILNGGQVPQTISYGFSDGVVDPDTGTIMFTYVGWDRMSTVGQQFTINTPAPASSGTWYFAARTGAWPGVGAARYTRAQLEDASFVVSPGFAVAGLAQPGTNVVTGISAGTLTYHIDNTSGWQWPELDGMNWTDPASDVNTWLVRFYVRETDVSGTPQSGDASGLWRKWFERQAAGGARTSIGDPKPLQITYRPAGDTHHYLQIQCVAANRLSQNLPTDWAGTDTASSKAQGSIIQIDFGELPAGKIPLGMADPTSSLPGARVTSIPGPSSGGFAISITIINGPTSPTGAQTYGWTGTITRPTDLTNYNGCVLTQQWAGAVEGGGFDFPTATQTTFHSGGYYPRGSADIDCTFRAYPVSRDNQRGTAASVTATVAAHATGTLKLDDPDMSTVAPSLALTAAGFGVNTTNLANMVLNGDFESGSISGWTVTAGACYTSTGTSDSGIYSLIIRADPVIHVGGVQETIPHACHAGDVFFAKARAVSAGSVSGLFILAVVFLNSVGTEVGSTQYAYSLPGAWQDIKLTATAPAGTSTAQVRVYTNGDTPGASYWAVDNVWLAPQVSVGTSMEPDGKGGVQVKAGGVASAQLAAAAVQATNMAAAAVTAANGALAANAVVDTNIVSVGFNKVTYGTSIFAGDVILSRGPNKPVIVLGNDGLTLFGQADPYSGASGLTSKPYVVIQNSGVGIYSGGNPSITMNSMGITLWSVGGNASFPYVQATSGGVAIVGGTLTLSLNGITTSLSNTLISGAYYGFTCSNNSTGYNMAIRPDGQSFFGSSISRAAPLIDIQASTRIITIRDQTSSYLTQMALGGVSVQDNVFSTDIGMFTSGGSPEIRINGLKVVGKRITVRPVTLADVINAGVTNGWWN